MRLAAIFWIAALSLGLTWPVGAEPLPEFSDAQRVALMGGEAVMLECRPGEQVGSVDSRFTTFAMIIEAPRKSVWEVVQDKENAADFLDGVLMSRVVEEGENWMLVEQKTKVGGPKAHYQYSVRHQLYPHQKVEFEMAGGELKAILGGWWFFAGPEKDTTILVYSLHIDPGIYAPQFIVKRGMKSSLPKTLSQVRAEVIRRKDSQ